MWSCSIKNYILLSCMYYLHTVTSRKKDIKAFFHIFRFFFFLQSIHSNIFSSTYPAQHYEKSLVCQMELREQGWGHPGHGANQSWSTSTHITLQTIMPISLLCMSLELSKENGLPRENQLCTNPRGVMQTC